MYIQTQAHTQSLTRSLREKRERESEREREREKHAHTQVHIYASGRSALFNEGRGFLKEVKQILFLCVIGRQHLVREIIREVAFALASHPLHVVYTLANHIQDVRDALFLELRLVLDARRAGDPDVLGAHLEQLMRPSRPQRFFIWKPAFRV